MTKKPSEWTPQEAYTKGQESIIDGLRALIGNTYTAPGYPDDPPEVASDNAIDDILAHRANHLSVTVLMMARELKERRAKDKP